MLANLIVMKTDDTSNEYALTIVWRWDSDGMQVPGPGDGGDVIL